jgi:hypothetical protein
MALSDLLNRNAGDVLCDHDAIDRLCQAASDASGRPWLHIFEGFMRSASDPSLSASDALRSAGVKQLASVAEGLRMLERADAELAAHHRNAAQVLEADERLDPMGRVLLDADRAAEILTSDTERQKRWQRAFKRGRADDRERWDMEDGLSLESGIDLLATAERGERMAQLRAGDQQLLKVLNTAIATGHRTGEGLKVLDAAIREARSGQISLAAAEPTGTRSLVQRETTFDRAQRLVVLEGGSGVDGRAILDATIRLERGEATMLDIPGDGEKRDAVKLRAGVDVVADRHQRLEEVRKVCGHYDGDTGAQRFFKDDRDTAERGFDLVKTKRKERDRSVAEGILSSGGRV